MFKNYLKIALRNLAKQKTYSAINILGLAVGLAGVKSFSVALLTTAFLAVRTAVANPVDSLRYE